MILISLGVSPSLIPGVFLIAYGSTMSSCADCEEFPTTGESSLCVKCEKHLVTQFESLLKKKARNYFEATLLGVTTNGILFLTDNEQFTAYLEMSEAELMGLRDYLNDNYPGTESDVAK